MFRCKQCHENSTHGESSVRVVVEKRSKTYTNHVKVKGKILLKQSEGWEIAKEIEVCRTCANEMKTLDNSVTNTLSSEPS